MVLGDKLTAAQCNFVHQDQIWKDHVYKEASVAKKWVSTWGFLSTEYQMLNKDLSSLRERLPSLKKPLSSPHRRSSETSPPLKLPPLKPPKQDTSNPFPLVTSKKIGWRSSRPECKLEVYGRWGRPKYTIYKQLKWPADGVA